MTSQAFTLPPLPYAYDALSPHISGSIMELHHDKHHQTYVDKLNAALSEYPELAARQLPDLLGNLDALPAAVRTAIRNHGGGHYNHSQFWQWLSPTGGGQPTGTLSEALTAAYGSYQQFVTQFTEAAAGVFGSGWAWLEQDLTISTSPNQDSPLTGGRSAPLLGLDVWEHAYYLDYTSKRADYINAWWDVINWQYVAEQFVQNTHA